MSERPEARAHGRAFAQCSSELRAPAWLVTAAAGLVHVSLFAAAWYLSAPSPSQASRPNAALLEVEFLSPPPPLAEKAPEPAPLEVEPPKPRAEKMAPAPEAPKAAKAEPAKAPEATPPPAAAQASAAATQTEHAPDAPSDTLVTGDGAHYAGGTTERGGSENQPVHTAGARASGVPDGTGSTPVDRSRAPQLAAGTDWKCPFPLEAEEDGIERATVGLEVEISANGGVLAVSIHDDPGAGFGREARACALKRRWQPALDKNGQPVQRKHRLNVTFIQS